MNRIVVAVSVAVLVFAVGAQSQTPAQTKTGTAEQDLLKLVQDWSNAEAKADVAFLDRILADDWEFTEADGVVTSKAQFLAALKSGDVVGISSVLDNIKVRVYGDAAVVTGRETFKAKVRGKDISSIGQWTDTWIKKAGRWQCVATHESLITQK
jgi:ketosteroid isomerase-like protein